MKYFTQEMWSGINFAFGKEKAEEYHSLWDKNFKEYYNQLNSITNRLDKRTYTYFSRNDFHDFRLVKMELLHNEYNKKPALQLCLIVTDEEICYELWFKNVTKFEVLSVENDKYNRGFDDWGYSEILPVDDNFLSFEVLFASYATIFVTFPNKQLKIKKIKTE